MMHNKHPLFMSINQYEKMSKTTSACLSFFIDKINSDGSLGQEVTDISAYFKLPMMLVAAKQTELAKLVLTFINKTFLQANGDFSNASKQKSIKPEYEEYWTYANGWIIRASNLLKIPLCPSVSAYFFSYYAGTNKGFLTYNLSLQNTTTDLLTTAHHGLIYLEQNSINLAISAGNYLCYAWEMQPDIERGIYLRLDNHQKFITDFKENKTLFYLVNKNEPGQLYFMLGYPCAFLALLYEITKNKKYLYFSTKYLDHALHCHSDIFKSQFSHKIAWAASIVYKNTLNQRYLSAINQIVNYFISTQDISGVWYKHADHNTQYDQSAEIACWLLDISNNIFNLEMSSLLSKPRTQSNLSDTGYQYKSKL